MFPYDYMHSDVCCSQCVVYYSTLVCRSRLQTLIYDRHTFTFSYDEVYSRRTEVYSRRTEVYSYRSVLLTTRDVMKCVLWSVEIPRNSFWNVFHYFNNSFHMIRLDIFIELGWNCCFSTYVLSTVDNMSSRTLLELQHAREVVILLNNISNAI